jgi:hypothetical protein
MQKAAVALNLSPDQGFQHGGLYYSRWPGELGRWPQAYPFRSLKGYGWTEFFSETPLKFELQLTVMR